MMEPVLQNTVVTERAILSGSFHTIDPPDIESTSQLAPVVRLISLPVLVNQFENVSGFT